jgi:DinB family protein
MTARPPQAEILRPGFVPEIARPTVHEMPPTYLEDIALLQGDDAWPILEAQSGELEEALTGLPEERALHRYAANKWSVKEVVAHLSDTERVFAYRALRFARGDETPLVAFDEDLYVANSGADARPIDALVDEFRAVRDATISLLSGFDANAFLRMGVARRQRFSVRAIVWLSLGHVRHHLDVLRDRYGVG